MAPARGNPVERSKWVRSAEFIRFWMNLNRDTQNNYEKLVKAFTDEWPQLNEANIKTKMNAAHKKYAAGLPAIPAPDRFTDSQLETEFPELVLAEK